MRSVQVGSPLAALRLLVLLRLLIYIPMQLHQLALAPSAGLSHLEELVLKALWPEALTERQPEREMARVHLVHVSPAQFPCPLPPLPPLR